MTCRQGRFSYLHFQLYPSHSVSLERRTETCQVSAQHNYIIINTTAVGYRVGSFATTNLKFHSVIGRRASLTGCDIARTYARMLIATAATEGLPYVDGCRQSQGSLYGGARMAIGADPLCGRQESASNKTPQVVRLQRARAQHQGETGILCCLKTIFLYLRSARNNKGLEIRLIYQRALLSLPW